MAKKIIDWEIAFQHWLSENLKRDRKIPYIYKDAAKRFGVAEKTVRMHASKDNWQQKLNEKLREQNQELISKIQEQELNTEAEIRHRQADLSRKLVDMAMTKLKSICPHELTVKQAIDLARLGLVEERKALGLPDKYEVTNRNQLSGDFISVEARIQSFERIDALSNRLLEYMGKDCN